MSGDSLATSVLVVDDNSENIALARATFEDEDIRVRTARSGLEAIDAFQREPADVILLDIRMPGLDGIETSKRLRALPRGADVAIVFVTAQRDVETFDNALAAGGDDFITKPYRPAELVARAHTAVRLRRLASERTELFGQLKRQRDDLQRLELQKQQLVAFLVHDLKNPVNAIQLNAERILRHTAEPRSRDAAQRVRDETLALMRMITTLLDLGRADEGRLVATRADVELRTLVDEVLGEQAERARARGVEVVAAVEELTVNADRDLLGRVLGNLLDNALRHAPESSTVRITARAVPSGVELRVADEGTGVAPEAREHVFERFVTGGVSADRTNRGLGLAFCKLAVEAHDGRIWVEDASPGAMFTVLIPQ